MDQLEATLSESMAGQGRMIMLAGEPGIGKTRTVQELASLAETRGAKGLWGWNYEEEGAPPYWPWVQAIRTYVETSDARHLVSEMGNGAANIADVVPEIHDKIADLASPPALEPEAARFRLFDSITTFLKNASKSQPLMLVLDDLHWADKPSLLLLQFLARELAPVQSGRLLLVGCYRDVDLSRQHPLSETLGQISRSFPGGFQRVLLRGLDIEDTARLIEVSAGIEPTSGLVEALYSHTEGNPFFMTETIRLLSESGELSAVYAGTPDGIRIPEGVRDVIGQRLNRLSERCNEVLTTASIVGREFDFRLLSILSAEMSEDQLLQAEDEAVSIHLIEGVPGQVDRYQFRHALIQQTLAEEVTTSRSVRLHAGELVYHFAEAEPVVGSGKLMKFTMLAGERALEAYAQEEALEHFRRGLIAKGLDVDGSAPAADSETAALLFGLGRAQAATLGRQQLDVAFASLSRAFDFYAETDDVARAVGVAVYPMQPLPGLRVAAELVARALQLVPRDSPEAGRLYSRYVLVMGLEEGDYQGAMEACDSALAIAQRTGDLALEMRTLA
jgi:predicted ATPase